MTIDTKLLIDSYVSCVQAYAERPSDDRLEAMQFAWQALDSKICRIEERARQVFDDRPLEEAYRKMPQFKPQIQELPG